MVVKCRVLLKLLLEIFGRIKSFACRYPLYFRRENVEVASVDVIFTGLLVESLESSIWSSRLKNEQR